MRERNTGTDAGERPAKSAGGVPLDDDQVGAFPEQRRHGPRDLAYMTVRIGLSGAAKLDARIVGEPKLGDVQRGVLTREKELGRDASGAKRVGDGCKLDGFGPGADHQADLFAAQLPPYLGERKLPPIWRKSSGAERTTGNCRRRPGA